MKRDEAVEGLDILHEALAAKTKEAAWALLFDKTPTLLDPIRAALESAERAEVGPVEAAARTLYDALEWRLSPNLVRGDLASDEWAAFLALGRVLGGSPQPAKPEAGPSRDDSLLAAHRRYHSAIGCPGLPECYVCEVERGGSNG